MLNILNVMKEIIMNDLLLKYLIQYYYNELDNGSGGYLHIVLDDGNIEHANIFWCQEECNKNGDTFGVFLCDVMFQFTEDKLDEMYNNDWWGMN